MNTKQLFLLALALLLATVSFSFAMQRSQPRNAAIYVDHAPADDAVPAVTLPKHNDPDHQVHHGRSPLQPEDGKHHHFHFTRIHTPRRRRPLPCLVCKIVLAVGHVACFLYCFFHVFFH